MGFSSWAHWLVILAVVVLIFGTKKLRNVGKDLGGAVHDFKKGLNEGSEADKTAAAEQPARNEEDAGKSG